MPMRTGAAQKGISAGHVGDIASAASWTPLRVYDATHTRQMPLVSYVVDTRKRTWVLRVCCRHVFGHAL